MGAPTHPDEVFRFDQRLVGALHDLAAREQRPTGEIAEELLYFALLQRENADENLERWRTLTPREQEIVALVCLNYTYRQIGARLGISPQTVKTHVYNALRKFGLRKKDELRLTLAEWDFNSWVHE